MHPVLSRLLVFELSHHSAPLQAREGLCWSESVCQQKAQQLRARGLVEDVVLLVTCNRTACIAVGDHPERLWAWWCDNLGDNQRYATRHHDRDALHYLLRMAVGLESMLVGEHHILGQFRRAFLQACQWQVCQGEMAFLCEQILCHAKQIRHEAQFAKADISLAELAHAQLQRSFSPGQPVRVLFMGSGTVIQQHLKVFSQNPFYQLSMLCRDVSKNQPLAAVYSLQLFDYSALKSAIRDVDVVICATASRQVLWAPQIGDSPSLRLVIDWSVPRNIQKNDQLGEVTWISMDDCRNLQKTIANHHHAHSVKVSEVKVWHALRQCCAQIGVRGARASLAEFRGILAELQANYSAEGAMLLAQGEPPLSVIEQVLGKLVNQLAVFFAQQIPADVMQQDPQISHGVCQSVLRQASSQLKHGQHAESVLKRALHTVTAKLSHVPTCLLRQEAGQTVEV
jgi:glutamyl-tRNA reductase